MEIFDVDSETHHFLAGEDYDSDSDSADSRNKITKYATINCGQKRRNLFSVDFFLPGH